MSDFPRLAADPEQEGPDLYELAAHFEALDGSDFEDDSEAGQVATAPAQAQAQAAFPSAQAAGYHPSSAASAYFGAPLNIEPLSFTSVPRLRTEWLLEGVIPKDNCLVMGAPPKTAKTWCLLDIAIAGAVGNSAKVFGKWPVRTEGYNTLVISPEGSFKFGLAQRLYSMVAGRDIDSADIPRISDRIKIWPGNFNIMNSSHEATVHLFIQKYNIDLVIVDPLANCVGTVDENNATAMLDALGRFRKLLTARPGTSLILSHHLSKLGMADDRRRDYVGNFNALRGSTALAGWFDGLISLSPVAEDKLKKDKEGSYDTEEDMEAALEAAEEDLTDNAAGTTTFLRNVDIVLRDDPPPEPLAIRIRVEHGDDKLIMRTTIECTEYQVKQRKQAAMGKAAKAVKAMAPMQRQLGAILDLVRKYAGMYSVESLTEVGPELLGFDGPDDDKANSNIIRRRVKKLLDDRKLYVREDGRLIPGE